MFHTSPHCTTLITFQVPDVSGIIERLLLFLDSGSEALTAEALVQMKDLLRRYPDMAQVWGSVRYKVDEDVDRESRGREWCGR